jgi:hypothetical protein
MKLVFVGAARLRLYGELNRSHRSVLPKNIRPVSGKIRSNTQEHKATGQSSRPVAFIVNWKSLNRKA